MTSSQASHVPQQKPAPSKPHACSYQLCLAQVERALLHTSAQTAAILVNLFERLLGLYNLPVPLLYNPTRLSHFTFSCYSTHTLLRVPTLLPNVCACACVHVLCVCTQVYTYVWWPEDSFGYCATGVGIVTDRIENHLDEPLCACLWEIR